MRISVGALRRRLPGPAKRLLTAGADLADPLVIRRARRRSGSAKPIPPRRLRAQVGAPGVAAYLEDGRQTAAELTALLDELGRPIDSFSSVYDFGSGSGRVLSWLDLGPSARAHASDVNADAVAWLGRSLPGVEARVNDPHPPAPFTTGAFDLIFSISIFTHLRLASQREWLADLRRLLRPDGLAVVTVLGPKLLERYQAGVRPGITPSQRAALRAADPLEQAGFLFAPEARTRWNAWRHRGVEREYGLAFWDHRRLCEEWSRELVVEGIRPDALNWGQDAVLLRSPDAG